MQFSGKTVRSNSGYFTSCLILRTSALLTDHICINSNFLKEAVTKNPSKYKFCNVISFLHTQTFRNVGIYKHANVFMTQGEGDSWMSLQWEICVSSLINKKNNMDEKDCSGWPSLVTVDLKNKVEQNVCGNIHLF